MPAAPNNQYAKKWTEKELIDLCSDLYDWAKNEKDIHIAGFALRHSKVPSWINWMEDTYPEFAEAKKQAMIILARKILNLSFYDKHVNAYVGLNYLGIYDKDYKDFMRWKAEIQKDSQSKENNKCLFNDTLKELKADDNNTR